ncbi:MAG: ComEC/Rec2 family competence protein, partial [Myxococcota bacterium]
CGRSVPDGPRFEGELAAIGVRVGSATGRVGDVVVARVARLGGAWVPADGRIRVTFPEVAPPAGDRVAVFGRVVPIRRALPGAPDPRRAAALAGVGSALLASRAEVLGGDRPELLAPHRDPTGLLRAIVLGDRTGCSPETLAILRRTGTSHLLSISGFHVGIAAAAVVGIVGVALRAIAAVRPAGVPTGWAVAVGIGAGWAYTALAGWPVAAERAAASLSIAALARAAGRRVAPIPALTWVAVGVAILDPGSPATPSYQLTFGAMYGLVAIVPRLTRWLPPDLPRLVRWVADGFAATIGSTLGTLPFAAWWFQQVAPLSAIANLVAVPVLGVAVVPIGAVACAAPAPIDGWAAALGTVACRIVLAVLDPLAVDPWTPAVGSVGAIAVGAAVVVGIRRPWLGLVLGVAALGWPRSAPEVLRVTVLDVGQGDAALVERADGSRWLVDGGPPSGAVVQWLRRSGIRSLDAVVVTHPDSDHWGGLVPVLTELDVGAVWAIDPPDAVREAAAARGVPIGVPLGAVYPRPEDLAGADGDNDRSIVLDLGAMLLTGDAEADAEARFAGRLGRIPVLKVGHHGSRTSTTDALLDAIDPELAIVSVGAGNPYGHPDPAVVGRLTRRGIPILRTDEVGTIEVEVQADGSVRVTPEDGAVLHLRAADLGPDRQRPGPSASAPQEHDQRRDGDHRRDPLRPAQHRAEHAGEEPAAIEVAAEHLEPGPGGGVQHDVQQEHLPVEPAVPVEPVRQQRDRRQRRRLVQLGRVDRHPGRGEQVVRRVGHRPRHVGRRAVAAAGGVAPHPADRVRQRPRRPEHVPQRERRQAVPPHQPEPDRDPDRERPVEHEPAAPQVEQVPELVHRTRVLDQERRPGADEPGDRHPEDHVGHPVAVHPEPGGSPQGEPRPHDERHRPERAVAVDRERADGEQDRVHAPG